MSVHLSAATTLRVHDHDHVQRGAIRLISAGASLTLTEHDQRMLAAVLRRADAFGGSDDTRRVELRESLRPGVCWRVKPMELLGRRVLTIAYEVQGHPQVTIDRELADAIAGLPGGADAGIVAAQQNGPTGVQ